MTEANFLKAVGLFLISLVRFSGFFINLPAFGEGTIPMRVKAGLAALCSLIVLPHLMKTQTLPELGIIEYGIMGARELVLGLTMGFVVLMSIDCLKFAGELIGMQVGFSFVQVVDPESSRGQAIIAEFFQVLGVLMFLAVSGHIILIQAFVQGFDMVPVAQLKLPDGVIAEVARCSATIFLVGLQVSLPVIAVILIGDVGLGIIARTVPRLNVFQVGFSLKIIGGFLTLIFLFPFMSDLVKYLLNNGYGCLNTLLNLFG